MRTMTRVRRRSPLALPVLLFVSGCQPKPAEETGLVAADRSVADPVVLHVSNLTKSDAPEQEGSYGAGFPYTESRVITAAHGLHELRGPIKVDGHVMRVEKAYRSRVRPNPPNEEDWVVLAASGSHFKPNRFAREWEPQTGQRVRVGGFLRHWMKRVEAAGPKAYGRAFNAAPPDFVEGAILDRALFEDQIPEQVFWMKVPKGDYHGLSGGPAAILDESGEPLIVGVMVAFGELEFQATGEIIYGLAIVRVPPPE